MNYGCYTNGFRFNSHLHLADFRFFFTFFQAYVLPLGVSVSSGLGTVSVGLG